MWWLVVIGISFAISAIGLLLYKKWARFVAIGIAAVSSFKLASVAMNNLAVPEFPQDAPFFSRGVVILGAIISYFPFVCIAIFVGIIYYLTRPKVKEQFR